jgi:anti-sigma B factor antagonist
MEITTTQYKSSDLVKANGRVDSYTAPDLDKALEEIINAGRYKIVLNMSDVEFISSAGLRVLISTQKKCKKFNRGELVLSAIPERVYTALDLAGFIPLFKITDNDTDAVGLF